MDRNKPSELRDIYTFYIQEIAEDMRTNWENREVILMDLKLLKEWYPKGWQFASQKTLAEGITRLFKKKKFFRNASNMFSQILAEEVRNPRNVLD